MFPNIPEDLIALNNLREQDIEANESDMGVTATALFTANFAIPFDTKNLTIADVTHHIDVLCSCCSLIMDSCEKEYVSYLDDNCCSLLDLIEVNADRLRNNSPIVYDYTLVIDNDLSRLLADVVHELTEVETTNTIEAVRALRIRIFIAMRTYLGINLLCNSTNWFAAYKQLAIFITLALKSFPIQQEWLSSSVVGLASAIYIYRECF